MDDSYDLTHCSYDLTVDSKQLTVSPSNDKYRPSGKSIAILGAILNRSLASPGINFRALINKNFFMSNKYLDSVFSLNFSSEGKGPFMASKAKNMCLWRVEG